MKYYTLRTLKEEIEKRVDDDRVKEILLRAINKRWKGKRGRKDEEPWEDFNINNEEIYVTLGEIIGIDRFITLMVSSVFAVCPLGEKYKEAENNNDTPCS